MNLENHRQLTEESFRLLASPALAADHLQIIVAANLHEDEDQSRSALHFDNCAFPEGLAKVQADYRCVWQQSDRLSTVALEALGRALHTQQDFYAHSNWIELHQDLAPIPLWDLDLATLPTGIVSGTWTRGNPKRCTSGVPSHQQLNKDHARSTRGRQRVLSGPNQGQTLWNLTYEATLRATSDAYRRFLSGITPYRITTITGDLPDAGTDACVFIVLQGEQSASSGRLYLDNRHHNDFERGKTDSFVVGSLFAESSLRSISIGYSLDEKLGKSPGFFLSQVSVESLLSGRKWTFPCNRWLSVSAPDRQTIVELRV